MAGMAAVPRPAAKAGPDTAGAAAVEEVTRQQAVPVVEAVPVAMIVHGRPGAMAAESSPGPGASVLQAPAQATG